MVKQRVLQTRMEQKQKLDEAKEQIKEKIDATPIFVAAAAAAASPAKASHAKANPAKAAAAKTCSANQNKKALPQPPTKAATSAAPPEVVHTTSMVVPQEPTSLQPQPLEAVLKPPPPSTKAPDGPPKQPPTPATDHEPVIKAPGDPPDKGAPPTAVKPKAESSAASCAANTGNSPAGAYTS